MTLLDVITALETAARGQQTVKTIVRGDVLRLNAMPDARYGAFAWVQRQHIEDRDAGVRRYSFSLFYIDRLTADKSNELEIQAVGIRTLDNILLRLEEGGVWMEGNHTFDTFNIRFADTCAGVWCNVTLLAPLDGCYDDFATGGVAAHFSGTPSTLRDVVTAAEAAASWQPAVNGVVRNDIYRLNAIPDARYGIFAWTQRQHWQEEGSSLVNYRFNFFYVDRLVKDEGNETEVQSVGMDVIGNVAAALEELGLAVSSVTFDTFTERFSDACAGVYAGLTVSAPLATLCADMTGDFNADFNDDFYIY